METRHRTVVSIEVDAADIKNAGEDISRAFDPKTIDAFEKSIERMTRSLTQLAAQTAKVQKLGGAGGHGGGGSGGGQQGGRVGSGAQQGGQGGGFWPTAVGSFSGTVVGNAFSRGVGALGQASQPSGLAQSLAGAVPVAGPALGPMVGALQTLYQSFAQVRGALSRSYGATGRTDSMAGLAAGYGVDPSEAPGMMAELAARSGLKGGALGAAFKPQLELEKILGVRGAGSVVGAQMTGGGRVENPAQLMLESVSAGITAGIQETRLDQHLQTVSSWVEHVRSQGIDFSVDSVNELTRGFSAMNFRGENALRMAQTIGEGAAQAVTGPGAGGIGATMAMEAARVVAREQGLSEDISSLIEIAQSRSSAFIRSITDLIVRGGGGDINAVRGLAQVFAPGIQQVDVQRLVSREFEDTGSPVKDVLGALEGRRAGFGAVSGTARHEAGLALRRAKGGGQVAGIVQDLQNKELDLSVRIAPETAKGVKAAMEAAEAIMRAKGGKGKARQAVAEGLNTVGDALGLEALGDAWQQGMDQGFGQSAKDILRAVLPEPSGPAPEVNPDVLMREGIRIVGQREAEGLTVTAGEPTALPGMGIKYGKPAAEIGRPSAAVGDIAMGRAAKPAASIGGISMGRSAKASATIGEIGTGASGALREVGAAANRAADALDQQGGVSESAVGH